MASPYSPQQNHILAALPAEDYARLLPDLELIRCRWDGRSTNPAAT